MFRDGFRHDRQDLPALILLEPRSRRVAAAFLLGAASVLGFAPFYLYPLPILALAGLFRLWQRTPGRAAAALLGFAFGLGLFGAGVSWIYVSLHDYGGMPLPVAVLATLLFCAFLALFPAAVGLAQSLVRAPRAVRSLLLIPALWVLSEWLRGWVFTGFPWLAMGYSQVPGSPLAGFAPVFGVYGVSLAVLVAAGLLLQWLWGAGARRYWALAMLALGWAGFGLQQVEWTTPDGPPLTVSLLQGNIPQELKWRADRVQGTLDTYARLVLASRSRLIILPETAIPLFYRDVPRDYLEMLARHAQENRGSVLIGLPEFEREGASEDYYNSVVDIGAGPAQTYRKHHLVPFGEYIPLKPLFGWIIHVLHIPLDDFARGAPTQQPMRAGGQRVAVNICYEDAFGREIIRQLPAATLLVNVSNDAWFGDSLAPYQHLQISQTRALESGRYMLRATNTGVTAIVDQRGRVVRRLPEFVTAALDGTAQGFAGRTPYVRWGNGAALAMLCAMLAGGLFMAWKRPAR